MSIEIGNSYWVLTSEHHNTVITKREYDALMFLKCVDITKKMDDGTRYYFSAKDSFGKTVSVTEWEVDQLIFKSVDDYLSYFVRHLDNLNTKFGEELYELDLTYEFDDFMKEKIKESRENHPEYWV